MTEKPNSVCSRHNKPLVYSQFHQTHYCPECEMIPKAEPAEPSASPRKMVDVGGKEHDETPQCKYSDCKPVSAEPTAEAPIELPGPTGEGSSGHSWVEPAAPPPVAGEGPGAWRKLPVGHWFFLDSPKCTNRYSVHERTDSGCTLVCSTPWHHDGAKTDMQTIADLHNSRQVEGTPKLEEIAWKIYLHDRKGYGNAITAQGVVSEWVEIIRPFITPACQSSIKFAGERADSPMASQSRTAMTSPAIQSTPASTGEANGQLGTLWQAAELLEQMYDKWENGDPSFSESGDSLGQAFQLGDSEDKIIDVLNKLFPAPTSVPQAEPPNGRAKAEADMLEASEEASYREKFEGR